MATLSGAERQRRMRIRRARRLIRVTVDLPEDRAIHELMRGGFLADAEALDPAAVRRAFQEFVDTVTFLPSRRYLSSLRSFPKSP